MPSIVAVMRIDQHQLADELARRKLRAITAPTEPGRGLAPISATDPGLNSLSRLRTDTGFYLLLKPGRACCDEP